MKPEPNLCPTHQCYEVWDEENEMGYCPKCRENFLTTRDDIAKVQLGKIREVETNLFIYDDKMPIFKNLQETYPPGEPILIPGKRYAYTTSGAPTGCTKKKWWNMEVIHHVPQLHKVWVKMEKSGIHRVIGTAEFTFKLLE